MGRYGRIGRLAWDLIGVCVGCESQEKRPFLDYVEKRGAVTGAL